MKFGDVEPLFLYACKFELQRALEKQKCDLRFLRLIPSDGISDVKLSVTFQAGDEERSFFVDLGGTSLDPFKFRTMLDMVRGACVHALQEFEMPAPRVTPADIEAEIASEPRPVQGVVR